MQKKRVGLYENVRERRQKKKKRRKYQQKKKAIKINKTGKR